ncbi:MAG TPA: TatD family hydrolase [Candidatus Omnitrophota bacterium]|nr:TatD family hydrolase [Candidatus Omnitrophota bacterium]
MKIYDTHAHLDQLEALDETLQAAHEAGVAGIVAISMDLASCRKNLEIKNKYKRPHIYLGLGMHPSEAKPADLDEIVKLIYEHHDHIHVIGEIGLDFWYKWVKKDEGKKNEQRQVYRRLLEVAKDLHLPAVIHSRGAWKECLQTALDVGVRSAEFHWYSGPLDVLDELLKSGYYVSTGPSVAYSPQSQEAMRHAPIERTLIETDCPVFYRNPQTNEGFQAQPKDVFRTLKAYCVLKNFEEHKALDILNKNAEDFFRFN